MQPDWVMQLNGYGQQRTPCFFVINFDASKGEVFKMDDLRRHDIQFQFPDFKSEIYKINQHGEVSFSHKPINFEVYQNAFEQVMFHLKRGDTYLTNLTFPTRIEVNIELEALYAQAVAPYKVYFKNQWLCFSPETFVKIQHGSIQTFPMKGTINAAIPHAKQTLLGDSKEKAEHSTIVDLLRNDLSMVAKHVHVEQLMYLDKIRTQKGEMYQMSSKIVGNIQARWHETLGTMLHQLLPAGSICGAPKQKTVHIIKQVENYQRGYYTGIAGYYDGETLDTCVLIRFIENTHDGLVYKSGGGITALSHVQKEYEELNQKIYVPIY